MLMVAMGQTLTKPCRLILSERRSAAFASGNLILKRFLPQHKTPARRNISLGGLANELQVMKGSKEHPSYVLERNHL